MPLRMIPGLVLAVLMLARGAVATANWTALQATYCAREPGFLERAAALQAGARLLASCGVEERSLASARVADAVAEGTRRCLAPGSRRGSDMWCVDVMDGVKELSALSFTHPRGLAFVGSLARFVFLPIPKAASSTMRHWNTEAFLEEFASARAFTDLLVPSALKPISIKGKDRCKGATVWRRLRERGLPGETNAVFVFVRDPLERFCSGWRELQAYNASSGHRPWGSELLRRLLGDELLADLSDAAPRERQERAMLHFVRALACNAELNEHLAPQSTFLLPLKQLARSNVVIAPLSALPEVLPAAAEMSGLDVERARAFALGPRANERGVRAVVKENAEEEEGTRGGGGGGPRNPQLQPIIQSHRVAAVWPQPSDVEAILDSNARDVWCWRHFPDYLVFPFFAPPTWCLENFRGLLDSSA